MSNRYVRMTMLGVILGAILSGCASEDLPPQSVPEQSIAPTEAPSCPQKTGMDPCDCRYWACPWCAV